MIASRILIGLALLTCGLVAPAPAQTVKIKLATLAPDGSPWHELLKDLQVAWSRVTDGKVELRIYAGGIAGDEPAVMKKLAINNYHAALVSAHGLSLLNRSTRVFSVPRLLRNQDELDHALEVMTPRLESELLDKGYVVLAWADAGWIHFFVPDPDPSIAAVKKHKLFSWAGDSEGLALWRQAGFQVVPLPGPELLVSLQTHLVNAFDTVPYYALASQSFRHTPYMIDMKWSPLPGALVVTKATWDRIPESLRSDLETEADRFALALRAETLRMNDQAVEAMQARGLQIVKPTPEQLGEWDRALQKAYPEFRGSYVPQDVFDRLTALVAELRRNSR